MRRLASTLFTLLIAATPATAQPYADQPYEYEASVDIDASIYTDVNVAPIGEEIPDVAVFYDRLAPYGTWTDDSLYGYVFAPADTNYVPYSNGYWRLTDFGWTWIAADQHGWATSHYGRWVWRNRWVWRPDTTWGPAWVQWRESDNVVGWAPLGYDVNAYIPETNWRFIPTIYITSTDVSRYYVRTDVARYVRDTRPIVRWNRHNDRRWVAGPDRAYLERNKVRVQRATYQPREIGRFDAQERRQLEQRAAEAKVKYRARVTRDQQVRSELDRKRVEVEHRQVEQQRQRVKAQPKPVQKVEQQRQAQERQQQQERQQKQIQQQQREQRDGVQRQREIDQRQQKQNEQKKQIDQRQQDDRERIEKQKRELQAKQVDQRKQNEARQQQQVEARKQQNEARQQQQKQQVEDRKQQNEARQQQKQQVEDRKQQQQKQRQPPKVAPKDQGNAKRDDKRDDKRDKR